MNEDSKLEELKAMARMRGGDCLSEKYQGVDTKLTWQCARGHVWQNRPAKIKKGQWCPFCIGRHKTIADMKALAKTRGGDCLSETYINTSTPLIWRCEHGHEWEARPGNVLFGTWCPYCRGQRQSIADLKALAEARGGDCLSSDYRGAAKKHLWRCRDGHTWQATPNSIKNGSWCPECHINYGEEICRLYFEAIFGVPFPKCRPEFLRTGHRGVMELDGYCQDLRLAFEHHGVQHYRTVSHFHQDGKSLQLQRDRDRTKLVLCGKAGVMVVEIPSVPDLTTLADLPQCITRGLDSLGIQPPVPPEKAKVSLADVYDSSCLERLQRVAEANGGRLLSNVYLGDRTKLRWRCAVGHEWDAVPANIKSGAWCALCYGNVTKSIEQVRDIVAAKGVALLSTKYHGNKIKLQWRCAKGHEWMATPQRVMHSTGCPRCAGHDKSIDDMKQLAQQRRGLCLSTMYRTMTDPLDWQCSQGHRFTATPNNVLRHKEQWCPVCGFLQRKQERITKGLDRLRNVAATHGGKLLSTDYIDAHRGLTFECKRKHTWNVSSTSVLRGSWCPFCASEESAFHNRAARLGIDLMKSIAADRGGKCLSAEYLSCHDKLLWECSRGHKWEATPSNIRNNRRWCPFCSGKMRKTVADMHILGQSRGFAFLSEAYLGDDKLHLWQCSNGHQWKAKPSNIKQGRGCPGCAKKSRWIRRRERLKNGSQENAEPSAGAYALPRAAHP